MTGNEYRPNRQSIAARCIPRRRSAPRPPISSTWPRSACRCRPHSCCRSGFAPPRCDGDPAVAGKLADGLREGIAFLESATGRRFGDRRRPLLVSVRSGAARSMPGMLDTVLNVGCTADAARGLIRMLRRPALCRRLPASFSRKLRRRGARHRSRLRSRRAERSDRGRRRAPASRRSTARRWNASSPPTRT